MCEPNYSTCNREKCFFNDRAVIFKNIQRRQYVNGHGELMGKTEVLGENLYHS